MRDHRARGSPLGPREIVAVMTTASNAMEANVVLGTDDEERRGEEPARPRKHGRVRPAEPAEHWAAQFEYRAGETQASVPKRITRPRTYIPVPAMINVTITWTVKARWSGNA